MVAPLKKTKKKTEPPNTWRGRFAELIFNDRHASATFKSYRITPIFREIFSRKTSVKRVWSLHTRLYIRRMPVRASRQSSRYPSALSRVCSRMAQRYHPLFSDTWAGSVSLHFAVGRSEKITVRSNNVFSRFLSFSLPLSLSLKFN